MTITMLDEFMGHQTIEPVAHVSQNDPSWAERLFNGFNVRDQLALHTGVSLYPNNDTVEVYACFKDLSEPGRQHSLRASTDLENGRWPLGAGPMRFHVEEPLRRVRIECGENELGLEFELVSEARGEPFASNTAKRYRKGRLTYDNQLFFQTMTYTGEVRFRGKTFQVEKAPGLRDRSWGIRSSGEGRIPRGLYFCVSAEFDDVAFMIFNQERQDGTVVQRSGSVTDVRTGEAVPLVRLEHDLTFHKDRQLKGAHFRIEDARGRSWELATVPDSVLFMSGAGYTSNPDRRGRLGVPFWSDTWDLEDPDVVAEIDGLNDHLSDFRLADGRRGRGFVETLYGEYEPHGLHAIPGTELIHG